MRKSNFLGSQDSESIKCERGVGELNSRTRVVVCCGRIQGEILVTTASVSGALLIHQS